MTKKLERVQTILQMLLFCPMCKADMVDADGMLAKKCTEGCLEIQTRIYPAHVKREPELRIFVPEDVVPEWYIYNTMSSYMRNSNVVENDLKNL